jgi:hypothetical protein
MASIQVGHSVLPHSCTDSIPQQTLMLKVAGTNVALDKIAKHRSNQYANYQV